MAVDMYAMAEVPAPIEADELLGGRPVTNIFAGHSHAACITDKGELFYWGSAMHLEPELVTSIMHTKVGGKLFSRYVKISSTHTLEIGCLCGVWSRLLHCVGGGRKAV